MQTIFAIGGTRIVMYPNDHAPAHFHVIGAGFEVVIEIGSWRVIRGRARRGLYADALAWAVANEAHLSAAWMELRRR